MDGRLMAADLAVGGLNDLGDPEPILREIVRERLDTLLEDNALSQSRLDLRIDAGRTLAVLGDSRDLDELIERLEYVLKNGLPKDLADAIRKDHHVNETGEDNKVSLRVRKLINEITESHTC